MTNQELEKEFDDLKEKIIAEYNSKIDVANQDATDVVLYSELFLKHFLNQDIKSFFQKAINQAQEEERERVLRIIRDIDSVWLAECFHDFYENFAKLKGWNTQEKTKVPFADLPKENKETMICTTSCVLMELQGKILMELSTNIKE